MLNPTIVQTYPAHNDEGIPVGISLEIIFDSGVDLETAKKSVVLYGPDFDMVSGPDQALWSDLNNTNSKFFLKSPGFKGTVPLDYQVIYWDIFNNVPIDPGTISSQSEERSINIGHKLIARPKTQLAEYTSYSFYVMGSTNNIQNGISRRTVFDPEADLGNQDSAIGVVPFGGYTRSTADRVIIEITHPGWLGEAKYKWWYESASPLTAILNKKTSGNYARLNDGVQVRFVDKEFFVGDKYSFALEPAIRMESNLKIDFVTGDGSYLEPPESPSTPASSLPPEDVFMPPGSDLSKVMLKVVDTVPSNGDYNVSVDKRRIQILFSEDLDPSTVNDNSVTLFKHSASGEYSETFAPLELSKKLTVDGNILIIDF